MAEVAAVTTTARTPGRQNRSTIVTAVKGLMEAKQAMSSGRSSGTGTHQEGSSRLYRRQAPAEPSGSTRRPSAAAGTPGPTASITPTPSNPGTRGNDVRVP